MKTIIKNEHAQAGVGTLIIFIAMVLVAAVAAAVLIQTSGVMQSKSTSTTKEAAAAIAENVNVEAVDGASTTSNLTMVNITIKVAAGGTDVDLTKFTLKVQDKVYNIGANTSDFLVCSLRDPDNGLGYTVGTCGYTGTPILKPGALAKLSVNTSAISGLISRKTMTIALTPEKGTTNTLPITLPAISGTIAYIALYP